MSELVEAVVYRKNLPISSPDSLLDAKVPRPTPGPRDLIVEVQAASVNPADVKRRVNVDPGGADSILGYDASGTVVEVGSDVALFRVGDEVYYAGSITRPGANTQRQAVDERIVGHKPTTLSYAEAAALPLTAITAWEALFTRFRLGPESRGTLLALGAAGGVGSVLIQLAKTLTGVTVIGTASRPESQRWVLDLGADHVVDHSADLAAQVLAIAPDGVDYIFSPQTPGNFPVFAPIAKPFGQITVIDDPGSADISTLKSKSLTWHWEYMFTRSMYETEDMIQQHYLLDRVAQLVDRGVLRTTLTTTLTPFTAERFREAHRLVETGHNVGKVVVSRV